MTNRWNPWLLAAAAMLAPAMMFAGSSAEAEPRQVARAPSNDAVSDEAPNACAVFCSPTTNECARTCGPDWTCYRSRCVQF